MRPILRALFLFLSASYFLVGCEERPPAPGCMELNLDGIPLGDRFLDTWVAVEEEGWDCRVRPSVYINQVGLLCSMGAPPQSASLTLGFVKDALVTAEIARSPAGPLGICAEQSLDVTAWGAIVLRNLNSLYGPAARSNHAQNGQESHTWLTREEEVTLSIDSRRGMVAILGTDRIGLRNLHLSAAEANHLFDLASSGTPAGSMAAEVTQNLHAISTAEQSYMAEFGGYLRVGLYPEEVPMGSVTQWRTEKSGSFAELGFSPSLKRVSCSYAVGVGDEPCIEAECSSFTAVASCDPGGNGQLVHWGLVHRSDSVDPVGGPFGFCQKTGVFSPNSGEFLGHNVVGLCEARHDGEKREEETP